MLRHRESGYLNQSSPVTMAINVELTSSVGSTLVWTPAAGRTAVVKGFRLVGMVTESFPSGFVAQILSFANTIYGFSPTIVLPVYPIEKAVAAGYQFVTSEPSLGDGVGFGVAGGVYLRLDAIAGSGVGVLKLKGVVWGEEV